MTPFHHASVPFTQAIANRLDGTYTYRLEGCYLKQYQNYPEAYEVCETVGDTLSVTVDGPDPDSVGTQLGYTFQARVNSTSPATATMLFIDRTSSAAGGGVFQDIVLRKSGNAFELVEPGSVAGTSPGSWSTTTAVDLVLNDINLDGFVDVLVRGLGSAITGAVDQIVYAPGRTGGSPTILTAVDSSLKNFLSEVSSWTQDPKYFQKHQEDVRASITILRENCFIGEIQRYCISYLIPIVVRSGIRHTNKSPEAREFAQQFSLVDGRINPDVTMGSQVARNLSVIFEDILGVEFLNGNLEQACTGTLAYDADSSLPCDSPTSIGRMLLGWLLDTDISPAHAQTASNVNTQLPGTTPGIVGYGQNSPPSHGGGSFRKGQYGTAKTIQSVIGLGKRWKAKYPDGPPIGVGDISLQGGAAWPDQWHNGHRDGKRVDVRPVRTDGENRPVTYDNDDYDFEKTKALIKTIFEDPNVQAIIFNDPAIYRDLEIQRAGLITTDPPGVKTHDNHIHIIYKE